MLKDLNSLNKKPKIFGTHGNTKQLMNQNSEDLFGLNSDIISDEDQKPMQKHKYSVKALGKIIQESNKDHLNLGILTQVNDMKHVLEAKRQEKGEKA